MKCRRKYISRVNENSKRENYIYIYIQKSSIVESQNILSIIVIPPHFSISHIPDGTWRHFSTFYRDFYTGDIYSTLIYFFFLSDSHIHTYILPSIYIHIFLLLLFIFFLFHFQLLGCSFFSIYSCKRYYQNASAVAANVVRIYIYI